MASKLIDSLRKKQPVASSKLASQYAAGRDLQMQAAVGSAKPSQPTTKGQSQQIGANLATTTASQALDVEQKDAATRRALGGMAVTEAATQRTGELQDKNIALAGRKFDLDMAASKFDREGRSDLAEEARNLKMLSSDARFQEELKEIASIERIAGSKQELAEYAQAMQQQDQEDIQAMEIAAQNLTSQLDRMSKSQLSDLERRTGKKVAEIKRDMERKLAEKKAKAAVKKAAWRGVVAVASVVASIYGTPAAGAAVAAAGTAAEDKVVGEG